jgi:hypothetical protein
VRLRRFSQLIPSNAMPYGPNGCYAEFVLGCQAERTSMAGRAGELEPRTNKMSTQSARVQPIVWTTSSPAYLYACSFLELSTLIRDVAHASW